MEKQCMCMRVIIYGYLKLSMLCCLLRLQLFDLIRVLVATPAADTLTINLEEEEDNHGCPGEGGQKDSGVSRANGSDHGIGHEGEDTGKNHTDQVGCCGGGGALARHSVDEVSACSGHELVHAKVLDTETDDGSPHCQAFLDRPAEEQKAKGYNDNAARPQVDSQTVFDLDTSAALGPRAQQEAIGQRIVDDRTAQVTDACAQETQTCLPGREAVVLFVQVGNDRLDCKHGAECYTRYNRRHEHEWVSKQEEWANRVDGALLLGPIYRRLRCCRRGISRYFFVTRRAYVAVVDRRVYGRARVLRGFLILEACVYCSCWRGRIEFLVLSIGLWESKEKRKGDRAAKGEAEPERSTPCLLAHDQKAANNRSWKKH